MSIEYPVVPGHEENLRIALSHILDNAVQFSPDHSEIHLTVWYELERVYLSIQDSGIGISAEVLPHIFQRFYRLDEAHSTPGFGLGLALARSIIDKHDGEISVSSQVGVGTLFTISLPIYQAEDGAI